MIWLGPRHGFLSDWITQAWVKATGRRIDLASSEWLAGPAGKPTGIGEDFYRQFAAENGLQVQSGTGLLHDFAGIVGPNCTSGSVARAVAEFYERTADYELEAWSEWSGLFRPFGRLLASMFSRRLQQLNVPLSALDSSEGITSEVIDLVDAAGRIHYTAWVRKLLRTGNVLYAGTYSACVIPGFAGTCIKVVFPLPNGNATVIMYPESEKDGALRLTSVGARFGDPGFYFTVMERGRLWARYVRAMQETIRVYPSADGEVRADHTLRFWGAVFLRLHYRLRHHRPERVATQASP